MPEPRQPSWKFYHPLPIWKVLLIFVVAAVVANLLTALISMAFGFNFSPAIGGGVGGFLGATLTLIYARKAKEALEAKEKAQ